MSFFFLTFVAAVFGVAQYDENGVWFSCSSYVISGLIIFFFISEWSLKIGKIIFVVLSFFNLVP